MTGKSRTVAGDESGKGERSDGNTQGSTVSEGASGVESDETGDSGRDGNDGSERMGGGAPKNTTPGREHEEPTPSTTVTQASEVVYTPRFAGFVLLLGALMVTGLLTLNTALIASSIILLLFLLIGAIQTPPEPADNLSISHTVTPEYARPGQQVTVEVTVTNTSEHTFPDIRFVDVVPTDLTVTDNTARIGEPLRPGDTVAFSYELTAKRGTYTFGTVIARSRSLIGSQWIQQPLTGNVETLRCAVTADDIPLEEQAAHYIGALLGERGGDGIEFHSTREYHRGDSPSRINWRQLAKTGDLSTITYREHQAADVTLIADVREWSRVNARDGAPSAAILTMYAAYQVTASLTDDGHYVGMVLPGISNQSSNESESNGIPYAQIHHGRSDDQRQQALEYLAYVDSLITENQINADHATPIRDLGTGDFRATQLTNDLFDVSPYQVYITDFTHSLGEWVNGNTQFIFITPMLDNAAQQLSLQLRSLGYPVTIISPDVTCPSQHPSASTADQSSSPKSSDSNDQSPGVKLQRIQRATRLEALRSHGLTVIDWNAAEPLAISCIKQTEPGSQ